MTFKISDHLIQYTDTGSVHYTSKVKLSEEYKMKLRTKKQLMNSLYGKPKNYTPQEQVIGVFTKDVNGRINGFNPSK